MAELIKPILFFDDGCDLCTLAVKRWKRKTGDLVRYEPNKNAEEFAPEVPGALFDETIVLLVPGGHIYVGAEAVLRAWAASPDHGRALWWYQNVPGFRRLSEKMFGLVSKCRVCSYKFAKILWRKDL